MGVFATIIIFVAAYLLQTTFAGYIAIFGIKPDLILAALICFGAFHGKEKGALMAVVMGIVVDLLFGKIFGVNTLMYLYIVVAASVIFEYLFEHNVLTVGTVTFVLSLAGGVIYSLILVLSGQSFGLLFIVKMVAPYALYTAVAAAVIHPVLARIYRRYEIA